MGPHVSNDAAGSWQATQSFARTGAGSAAAFGAVTATAGAPVWATVAGVMAIVITSIHVSMVRLSIGAGRIAVGQGPWSRRARVIPVETVASATDEHLGWRQVFGLGTRFRRKTGRLTVRPGPTLCLQLTGGEHLRISTRDPAAACSLLPAAGTEGGDWKGGEKMSNGPSRPWFGPKRIGYGLRPQTWQGWAIVLAVAAAVVALMVILRH